nr:MAG TPA: hypothetical protein [Caudoviricetes sp.]
MTKRRRKLPHLLCNYDDERRKKEGSKTEI